MGESVQFPPCGPVPTVHQPRCRRETLRCILLGRHVLYCLLLTQVRRRLRKWSAELLQVASWMVPRSFPARAARSAPAAVWKKVEEKQVRYLILIWAVQCIRIRARARGFHISRAHAGLVATPNPVTPVAPVGCSFLWPASVIARQPSCAFLVHRGDAPRQFPGWAGVHMHQEIARRPLAIKPCTTPHRSSVLPLSP